MIRAGTSRGSFARATGGTGPLILDVAGITASAAYGLRQLRKPYTGAAVKVRRSSDSTSQDIGFVRGRLDISSLTAFVGAGTGFVSKWYDQSSHGFDMAQGTTANQPTIVTSGGGTFSRPRILFAAASSQFLTVAAQILPSVTAGGTDPGSTIYAVGAVNSSSTQELFSNWRAANSGVAYYLGITGAGFTVRFGDQFTSAGTLATPGTTWQFTARKTAGAGSQVIVTRQNGIQLAASTAAAPTIDATVWAIGQQGNLNSEYWNGEVDEVIITDATSPLSLIETNQRSYFGTA